MVVSWKYTPTPAAHQFSSELGNGNPGAKDFGRWSLTFFPVRSRLPQTPHPYFVTDRDKNNMTL